MIRTVNDSKWMIQVLAKLGDIPLAMAHVLPLQSDNFGVWFPAAPSFTAQASAELANDNSTGGWMSRTLNAVGA